MIIGTTLESKINSMAHTIINKKNIDVQRDSFSEFFQNTNYDKNLSIDVNYTYNKTIEKRTYLLQCYKYVTKLNQKKIKLQLPCGTGKTYIMIYIIIL